jgi:uncharacterized membrane protein YfcA
VSPLGIGAEIGILLASVLAGVFGSMLGLGAGVFFVPVLSVFFGVPLKIAVAASAISVIVNSTGGTSVYLRTGLTNIRLALVMELTTTVGAIAGGVIVILIAPRALRFVLAIALFGMGLTMLRSKHEQPPIEDAKDPLRLRQTFVDGLTGARVTYVPTRLALGLTTASFAGVLSGMLGIGGGVLKVPIMNSIMRVPLRATIGTSMYMVGITVSASAFVYYSHGLLDPSVAVPSLLGVAIGSQTGSRLGRRLKSHLLTRLLVMVLLYLAVTLLLQALGIHMPGTRSAD